MHSDSSNNDMVFLRAKDCTILHSKSYLMNRLTRAGLFEGFQTNSSAFNATCSTLPKIPEK